MDELLDTAPCGFLRFDDKGQIQMANATLLEHLRYQRADLIGLPIDKILPVASKIFYQTHLFPMLKLHGRVDEVYISVCTSDGEQLPMLVNAVRRTGPQGPMNDCVLIQMRQRSEYEDEILNAKRQAEDAVRAKDEFLAMVSHELRTPLSAIKGWSTMLTQGVVKPPDTPRVYETIQRSSESLKKLIEDLLDFSRMTSGKLRLNVIPLELTDIVAGAVDTVKPAADARAIGLTTNVVDTAPVSGDPDRLQQVLWNLLSNAIKFTPKGGEIVVEVGRVNSSVEIAIRDNGEGISAEFLPYVFDRFRQAEGFGGKRHGGLGLGMAISRHIVELHGGVVRAESDGPGKGSTFYVRLPVLTVRAQATLVDRPDDRTLSGLDSINIVLAEDDDAARGMLKTVLEHAGASVTTAADMSDALNRIHDAKPDILISDIEMPDGDGFELIKTIRALPDETVARLPAIALTANARQSDRIKTLAAGYQAHIVKPCEPLELVLAILNLTNRNKKGTAP